MWLLDGDNNYIHRHRSFNRTSYDCIDVVVRQNSNCPDEGDLQSLERINRHCCVMTNEFIVSDSTNDAFLFLVVLQQRIFDSDVDRQTIACSMISALLAWASSSLRNVLWTMTQCSDSQRKH